MSVFTAELKKLWILFKADPKSLVAGIIAPTILLLVFAITFGDFTSLKLAYVNEDPGPYGKALETSLFTQVSPLGDKPYFEEISAEYETAMDLYAQGKVNGVVVVGETFSADLQQGGNASIDYWFNNYNTDMAKNLRLYLQEGILDFYRTTDPQVQIQVEEVLNVDTQLHWFHIIAIAVFLLAFLLGSMFNMLYLFYKEKVEETLYVYRLSPNSIWASLFARVVVALLAGAITAGINAVLCPDRHPSRALPAKNAPTAAGPGRNLCLLRGNHRPAGQQLQRLSCLYHGDHGGVVVPLGGNGFHQILHRDFAVHRIDDPQHLWTQPDPWGGLSHGPFRGRHFKCRGRLSHSVCLRLCRNGPGVLGVPKKAGSHGGITCGGPVWSEKNTTKSG